MTAKMTTAQESFTLLAERCTKLQPPARSKALADHARLLADRMENLPLTPTELADALAILGTGYGTEPKDLRARRYDCVDMAASLAVSQGVVAGVRPPSSHACQAWQWMGDVLRDAPQKAEAARELIELVGTAAMRVLGRGPVRLVLDTGKTTTLADAQPHDDGVLAVAGVASSQATYELPVMLMVPKQAAVHQLVHPWAKIGLRVE